MVMYQGQLQDLPAFLKTTSALAATVSVSAGVVRKSAMKWHVAENPKKAKSD